MSPDMNIAPLVSLMLLSFEHFPFYFVLFVGCPFHSVCFHIIFALLSLLIVQLFPKVYFLSYPFFCFFHFISCNSMPHDRFTSNTRKSIIIIISSQLFVIVVVIVVVIVIVKMFGWFYFVSISITFSLAIVHMYNNLYSLSVKSAFGKFTVTVTVQCKAIRRTRRENKKKNLNKSRFKCHL